MTRKVNRRPAAIVGMGCFFPGSPDLRGYWRLLVNGRDAIGEVPPTHWLPEDYFDPDPRARDRVYCARGGFLSPVDFDPTAFGIPPAALEATDTSQLLALLAARRALADMGLAYDPARTSVILGVTGTQELVIPLSSRLGFPRWRRALAAAGVPEETAAEVLQRISDSYAEWQENSFPGLLGNVVAGRISNRLNLGGTNCVVDAACASSLAAVHLALLELDSGRCDLAITGGVDTLNDIFMHLCFAKTQVLSASGDARPFSRHADGTVLGEGVGIVVLKRLEDARRDGNRIYAVLRGLGSSSDGRSQSIYAPRREGQMEALRAAYAEAGIDPATVGMIEAHGTGTRVGDRVEFEALCEVLGGAGAPRGRCALGSVKSMIGHTKAAAGAAGLIKAALALYHRVLPPTLKAEEPDPALRVEESPFHLNTRARPWLDAGSGPRRAGVSAFGFGGSNFHAVLEESPDGRRETAWDGSLQILAFSGSSREALQQELAAFAEREWHSSEEAWMRAAVGQRDRFDPAEGFRLLFPATGPQEARALLREAREGLERGAEPEELAARGISFGVHPPAGSLAVLFPGQGSQYPDMGRELVIRFPEALDAIETAQRTMCLKPPLGELLYPPHPPGRPDEERLQATEYAQPAIAAVSLAFWKVVSGFGLQPAAAAGHSFGELTALCAAGRITEEAFFALAAARGRAMAAAPPGAMAAVFATAQDVDEALRAAGAPVVLANRNAPRQAVVSGPAEAIERFAETAARRGLRARRLPVGGAFHSPLMNEASAAFAAVLESTSFAPAAATAVFCGQTASPYPADGGDARRLLADQMLHPVDFVGTIEAMYAAGIRTFFEIGPRSVLTRLVADILAERPHSAFSLDASAGRTPGLLDLASALCRLGALGYPVRLERWDPVKPPEPPARLRIPICGANLGPPASGENDALRRPEKKAAAPTPPAALAADAATGVHATPHPFPSREAPMANETFRNPKANPGEDPRRVLEEGFEAIRRMHEQTAQAHEKFLDLQRETTQALMDLLRGAEAGALSAPEQPDFRKPALPPQERPAVSEIPSASSSPPATPEAPLPPAAAPTPAQEALSLPAAATAPRGETAPQQERLKEVLLEVVSRLTGYPPEMLGLDMDIEADLGIDSIKRVEILSALEERLPGLRPVTPEDMPRLRTLAAMVSFLAAPAPAAAAAEASPPARAARELAPSGRGTPAPDDLQGVLLEVVSRLTGYPPEMLGLDMDIEADLGIDSIKRVEILSALEERLPGLRPVTPEDMPRLRTLAAMVSFLAAPAPAAAAAEASPPGGSCPQRDEAASPPPGPCAARAGLAPRRVVSMEPAPPSEEEAFRPPAGRKIFVTEDRAGLARALLDALGDLGLGAVLVSPDILNHRSDLPPACGLIFVASAEGKHSTTELREAFELARRLGPDLLDSARRGAALFATVTRLDGACGFGDRPLEHPLQGALAGLAKTAAREWPEVLCHALDLDPGWKDVRAAARAVVREALQRGPVEVGLGPGGRLTPRLVQRDYPVGTFPLSPGEAVIVSGGARGITAACALALARQARPALVLLGRTPPPGPEPSWMEGLKEEGDIRRALVREEFSGAPARPAEAEKRLRELLAAREIRHTLKALEELGVPAVYQGVDIRDGGRLAAAVAEARARFGPIRGLIHGAGVLEDRLILDKTSEQFDRVVETKLGGFLVLRQALAGEDLRLIVLFSSVTARFGNRGQADYAMANEALNKLARAEAQRRPGCRVVAVNWGPWDCGMVTPAIRREFERQGVELLSAEQGAASLIAELCGRPEEPAEVVIGGVRRPALAAELAPREAERLRPLIERQIDAESHPVLGAHVLGDRAVVPMALLSEWLGEGALHENPGLVLHGLEDFRLLKGIRLENGPYRVRVLAGRPRARNGGFEVDLELRGGSGETADTLHCRARGRLAESHAAPPPYRLPEGLSGNHYPRSPREVYEAILFHGEALQGLRRIRCFSPAGMVADVATAPCPERWIAGPLRRRWLGDPLAIDSAFQMASLWSWEMTGAVALPAAAASLRLYRETWPEEGCRVVLEIREATERRLRGDFVFLDRGGLTIAQLCGFEAVIDPSLNRAFKAGGIRAEPLASAQALERAEAQSGSRS